MSWWIALPRIDEARHDRLYELEIAFAELERQTGADASHAWISLFVPDAGWVDLDPTNNLISGERLVTLAWGRDYGDVTPVKGVFMGDLVRPCSVFLCC